MDFVARALDGTTPRQKNVSSFGLPKFVILCFGSYLRAARPEIRTEAQNDKLMGYFRRAVLVT